MSHCIGFSNIGEFYAFKGISYTNDTRCAYCQKRIKELFIPGEMHRIITKNQSNFRCNSISDLRISGMVYRGFSFQILSDCLTYPYLVHPYRLDQRNVGVLHVDMACDKKYAIKIGPESLESDEYYQYKIILNGQTIDKNLIMTNEISVIHNPSLFSCFNQYMMIHRIHVQIDIFKRIAPKVCIKSTSQLKQEPNITIINPRVELAYKHIDQFSVNIILVPQIQQDYQQVIDRLTAENKELRAINVEINDKYKNSLSEIIELNDKYNDISAKYNAFINTNSGKENKIDRNDNISNIEKENCQEHIIDILETNINSNNHGNYEINKKSEISSLIIDKANNVEIEEISSKIDNLIKEISRINSVNECLKIEISELKGESDNYKKTEQQLVEVKKENISPKTSNISVIQEEELEGYDIVEQPGQENTETFNI